MKLNIFTCMLQLTNYHSINNRTGSGGRSKRMDQFWEDKQNDQPTRVQPKSRIKKCAKSLRIMLINKSRPGRFLEKTEKTHFSHCEVSENCKSNHTAVAVALASARYHFLDEDLGEWPSTAEAAAAENDERERRKKAREAKRAKISERAKAAREAADKAGENDSSKTSLGAASERGRQRSKSQSRSDKDKKKDKEKEKKNNAPSRGRSQSRGASRSARSSSVNTEKTDGTKRSRSMSVKSKSALKTGGKTAKKKRGKSLDTKKSSSGSESSGSKRKAPSNSEDDKGQGSGKTAKFAEGIPMNAGKTASTKKHAKAAKKGKSYSDKTKTPEKTTWPYRTYIFWTMKVGKVLNTCAE
eukprot:scaffold25237_cov55-Cyclotella_meneghiniana.AAC.1